MTSVVPLTDFPDRLSPMVVKELRQGLHTKVFGGVMLVLHGLLILFTLMSGGPGNTEIVNAWFDGIITLVLCIVIPLRGFSAVADELKAGTLDMLVLTRLSAGRIVFGKWAAIASQSMLIALSVLPYVVARYVFGGLDLFGEVSGLFYKWLAGVVVAAVIVALSTQRQFWLRAVVVGLPMLMGGCGMLSYVMVSRMGVPGATGALWGSFGGVISSALLVPLLLGVAAWAIFFFLSLASTRIAPAASLLSVVKRSVHLAALLIVLGLASMSSSLGSGMSALAGGMLSLVMIDVMTERVNEVPSVYAAFYRRGWVGRVALWLLAPGWATGLVYSLVLVALVAAQAWHALGLEGGALVVIGASGTWMIAVIVQSLSSRKSADLLPSFIIVWLIVNVVISSLGSLVMMPFSMGSKTAWFSCVLPQLLPMAYATATLGDKAALLNLGVACSLIWPLLLMVLGAFAWRRARSARQEGWRIAHGTEGGKTA